MTLNNVELFETIAKSYGLGMAIMMLATMFFVRLYFLERADRREAWKSHNELAKETNKILSQVAIILESVKQEVFRGRQ